MSTPHCGVMSAAPSAPVAGLALLPCPFCGGEPRPHAHAGNVWVECESCCAKTAKAYKSFAKANSYWNRRAANRAPVYDEMLALVERYASECAECGGSWMFPTHREDPGGHMVLECWECADIRAVIAEAYGLTAALSTQAPEGSVAT